MVRGDQTVSHDCQISTPCSLLCLHSWPLKPLDFLDSNIATLLQPLEDAIQHLIPALTGHPPCSTEIRDLLAFPVRLGEMGITNPISSSIHVYKASIDLTSPLVADIVSQNQDKIVDIYKVKEIKSAIRQSNRARQTHQADIVYDKLSSQLKRHVDLAKEKAASSWLSVLPLDDHGFSLNKGAFRDAVCLRYGWTLPNTPSKCSRGTIFSANHAMICPKEGFLTIRHNEIRDLTASLLTNVCHNVATEPRLQPLSGELMSSCSAITTNEARLDIRVRGFWSTAQDAYFDVRVFHPHATSNGSGPTSAAYKKMKPSRNVHMVNVFVILNMGFLYLWSLQPLEEWDRRQPSSTKD